MRQSIQAFCQRGMPDDKDGLSPPNGRLARGSRVSGQPSYRTRYPEALKAVVLTSWARTGPWEPPRGPCWGSRHRVRLQLAHEGDQGGLLPRRQLYAQDEVEELHRVLQREQPPVVQVRRGILDTPQGEGLDRPLGMNPLPIDGAGR